MSIKNIFNILTKSSNIGLNNKSNRDNWLKYQLSKIPNGENILDAGSGEQQYKILCQHLNYVSQDFCKYDGLGDNKGLQTKKWDISKTDIISDIINIPKPNNSFDNIMCVEVFEHIPEPILAIKEFSRLLKVGGKLVLTAPFCSLTHFAPYHYYTGFNRYFYEKYLKEYNFNILEIFENGNYFEYIAQELWRVNDISKKYSNSQLSIFDKALIKLILRKLEKISKNDNGSKDILNFGICILAEKT